MIRTMFGLFSKISLFKERFYLPYYPAPVHFSACAHVLPFFFFTPVPFFLLLFLVSYCPAPAPVNLLASDPPLLL